jgi:hypothetical protein
MDAGNGSVQIALGKSGDPLWDRKRALENFESGHWRRRNIGQRK